MKCGWSFGNCGEEFYKITSGGHRSCKKHYDKYELDKITIEVSVKWYKFEDKMPMLGTNILVSSSDRKICIVEFGLEERRFIKYPIDNGACDGNEQPPLYDFVDDDPKNTDYQIAIECAKYWCYPSSIKLPKEKNG